MNFKEGLKAFVAKVKSDGHVPVALLALAVTTTVYIVTKKDLGPGYVNAMYAFYAFLAGDKFFQNKYNPDSDTTSTLMVTSTSIVDQPKQ
jgi:hypothetical protein